jgi:hypothetical protein
MEWRCKNHSVEFHEFWDLEYVLGVLVASTIAGANLCYLRIQL